MFEKTFKIMWPEDLGEDWIDICNLYHYLFSWDHIVEEVRDKVKVEEVTNEKRDTEC